MRGWDSLQRGNILEENEDVDQKARGPFQVSPAPLTLALRRPPRVPLVSIPDAPLLQRSQQETRDGVKAQLLPIVGLHQWPRDRRE